MNLPLRDPSQPLPFEVPPGRRALFIKVGALVLTFGLGVMVGFALSPETEEETLARITTLESELHAAKQRALELDRAIQYRASAGSAKAGGQLKPADKARHERESKRYAKILRSVKAQSAAELIQWFVGRWNSLLENPEPNDRITRRAELLARLVGGMAANLDPSDYVPWQAEFLNANWLGDVHFDLDGDGFPGKRSMANPRDGFVDASVCLIAMALNQSMRDARVLVMPDMQCDRPEAKMSVFLQGNTLDDGLSEFVRALKREGFVALERVDQGTRLVLIGKGTRGATPE